MTDSTLGAPTASAVPAADVVAPAVNTGPLVHQSFPLRQPEEDANEIMVSVRGRALKRARGRLADLTKRPIPWPEILLGIATLALGGSLGAIGSSLPWAVLEEGRATPSLRSILFYLILPVAGTAAAVGYFSLRHFSNRNASDIAQAVLEDLPDPDRTSRPTVQ